MTISKKLLFPALLVALLPCFSMHSSPITNSTNNVYQSVNDQYQALLHNPTVAEFSLGTTLMFTGNTFRKYLNKIRPTVLYAKGFTHSFVRKPLAIAAIGLGSAAIANSAYKTIKSVDEKYNITERLTA